MNICLNLGCGGLTRFPNTPDSKWINIDARSDVGADRVMDCMKLDYANGSIYKIACVHMLEHLPRNKAPVALKEWYRVLVNGGTIIIEVPNFDLTIKEYLEGDDAKKKERVENVYGRQSFEGDTHFWGYNYTRLRELLESVGFRNVTELTDYSYHKNNEPCLKVSAKKV